MNRSTKEMVLTQTVWVLVEGLGKRREKMEQVFEGQETPELCLRE